MKSCPVLLLVPSDGLSKSLGHYCEYYCTKSLDSQSLWVCGLLVVTFDQRGFIQSGLHPFAKLGAAAVCLSVVWFQFAKNSIWLYIDPVKRLQVNLQHAVLNEFIL